MLTQLLSQLQDNCDFCEHNRTECYSNCQECSVTASVWEESHWLLNAEYQENIDILYAFAYAGEALVKILAPENTTMLLVENNAFAKAQFESALEVADYYHAAQPHEQD